MSSFALKKLAGETAIYGMSTILARFINFLLVPLYTRVLATSSYGELSDAMAYIAILQVILVLGLETGCFRFANTNEDPKRVFSSALSLVGIISVVTFVLFSVFSGQLASLYGYEHISICFVYIGGILASDAFTAILFARLRFEHKALKFATFKTIKILTETISNLILFLVVPSYLKAHPDSFLTTFIPPTPDFSYVIFAIFLSCVVAILLFIPELLKFRFKIDKPLLGKMLAYSLPLMIAGLPGIMNDMLDRLLFRFILPDAIWKSELGIFTAGARLAVIMMLFIQMFRFAAEPFFFAKASEKDSRKLYSEVMNHFTAFGMFIFLGVMLFIDIIGLFLGKDFRGGISILPVMLMAYLLLGITYNVSMWYKLSGKTNIAIYITSLGLVVTLIVNIGFMPAYSFHASAWGHLLSYLVMLIVSTILGNKYYPIPYKWLRVLLYISVGLALYGISLLLPQMHLVAKFAIHSVLILIYIFIYLKIEKISLWKLKL